MTKRGKTTKPAPVPAEDFSVLMLVRDRDEQKRIADSMQALYLAESEVARALRSEVERLTTELATMRSVVGEIKFDPDTATGRAEIMAAHQRASEEFRALTPEQQRERMRAAGIKV